jgi:hypothetical protein
MGLTQAIEVRTPREEWIYMRQPGGLRTAGEGCTWSSAAGGDWAVDCSWI